MTDAHAQEALESVASALVTETVLLAEVLDGHSLSPEQRDALNQIYEICYTALDVIKAPSKANLQKALSHVAMGREALQTLRLLREPR